MTTPIPIIAPKKDYSIIASTRVTSTHTVVWQYNLVDQDGNQLVDQNDNDLVASIPVSLNTFDVLAPKKDYSIIAPERNNA
jgi:hypothetical protein